MHKETVKYTDYNGYERNEDFYFNLTEVELIDMEYDSKEIPMTETIRKIVKANDVGELIKLFKFLLLKSYGEKSSDGKRFIKSEELSKSFSETPVFPKLFMELANNDEKAAVFINEIVPGDVVIDQEEGKKLLDDIANAPTSANLNSVNVG